jgi:hypothetical protein
VKAFGIQEGPESERLRILSNEWFARLPLEKKEALIEFAIVWGSLNTPSMS